MPKQLLTHGQWWSIISTHLSQTLQWCVRAGLISSQFSQRFYHICLTSSTVFALYRIACLNSADNPSNLSLFSRLASFFEILFLYYKRSFSIFANSAGPLALIIMAIVWLNRTLKPRMAPTQPQTILKRSPTLSTRTPIMTLRNASMCKYIK